MITYLGHFWPIILQPIVHRHKYKAAWLIYYIKSLVKSLPYKHVSGHVVKAEAENVKWRLPLKPHFDSLGYMPYHSLYHTFFFPCKSPPPQPLQRIDRAHWVGSNSVFSCYPNLRHSKVPYLPHIIQTHHWTQNTNFLTVFFCGAILPQYLGASQTLMGVLSREVYGVVISILQTGKVRHKEAKVKMAKAPTNLGSLICVGLD